MTVKRRAILHIGTPKTGSTSIQAFLQHHRDMLLTHGVVFAASPGRRNHLALAVLGAGEAYTGYALTPAGGGGDPQSLGPRLQRDLATEMAALGDDVHTVVFSSEQISRLSSPTEVERVRGLLAPHFESIRVLVYLRRQDELAVSQYSTALRAGGETSASVLPAAGEEAGFYNLAGVVESYAAIFGQAAIMPRIFDRISLVGGDVVRDFLEVCGVVGVDTGKPTSNPALRADVQEFVRRFNVAVEERGLADRPRLGQYLRDSKFQGKARLPTRSEAQAFLERFRESNDRLRISYFPDRAVLFAEDFSRYPETADVDAISDARVLRVALDIVVDLSGELRLAQFAAAFRAGEAAEAAGRLVEARQHYSHALQGEKDNKLAKQALLRLDRIQAKAGGETAKGAQRRGLADGKAGRKREQDSGASLAPDAAAVPPAGTAPDAVPPEAARDTDRAARRAKRKAERRAA